MKDKDERRRLRGRTLEAISYRAVRGTVTWGASQHAGPFKCLS